MSLLQIHLFGEVRVMHDGKPHKPIRPTVQTLLAFLLLYKQHSHHRETLTELFWDDNQERERSKKRLRTVLWRLRLVLEPQNVPRGTYLLADDLRVGFNTESDYWLDTAVFEEKANFGLSSHETTGTIHAQNLEEAINLYRGDLLNGFYDDWVLYERERLRLLYLKCLTQLMVYYRYQNAHDKSEACGQKILAIDPLREEIHRTMMYLYIDMGQRSLAIKQYQSCRYILSKELGILPMKETQKLYQQLVSQDNSQYTSLSPINRSINLEQIIQQFNQAMKHFENAQKQFEQVAYLIASLAERSNKVQ